MGLFCAPAVAGGQPVNIVVMSAVVPPSSLPPVRTQAAGPAAVSAAAASFAAPVDRLDYLRASDVDLLPRAYRFADEAHL